MDGELCRCRRPNGVPTPRVAAGIERRPGRRIIEGRILVRPLQQQVAADHLGILQHVEGGGLHGSAGGEEHADGGWPGTPSI